MASWNAGWILERAGPGAVATTPLRVTRKANRVGIYELLDIANLQNDTDINLG